MSFVDMSDAQHGSRVISAAYAKPPDGLPKFEALLSEGRSIQDLLAALRTSNGGVTLLITAVVEWAELFDRLLLLSLNLRVGPHTPDWEHIFFSIPEFRCSFFQNVPGEGEFELKPIWQNILSPSHRCEPESDLLFHLKNFYKLWEPALQEIKSKTGSVRDKYRPLRSRLRQFLPTKVDTRASSGTTGLSQTETSSLAPLSCTEVSSAVLPGYESMSTPSELSPVLRKVLARLETIADDEAIYGDAGPQTPRHWKSLAIYMNQIRDIVHNMAEANSSEFSSAMSTVPSTQSDA